MCIKKEGKREGKTFIPDFVFYAKTKFRPIWRVVRLAIFIAYGCATARDLHPIPPIFQAYF